MQKRTSGDWYDYPQYYNLAFADETGPEADFLEHAFAKYATRPVKRLLEPGCGGGRLVVEMARRGFDMTAFDTNDASLAWLRKQLQQAKLKAKVYADDMTDFKLPRPVDAAFNTFNTFRHLLTESAARSHLEAMAHAVQPGGIYVLGLHLLPPDASEECTERWRAKSGREQITFTLRVISSSCKQRIERMRVSMLVRSPGKDDLRLATEFDFRLYTAAQLKSLLKSVPAWELCDVFDFWYELEKPLKLTNELSDTVLILRRV